MIDIKDFIPVWVTVDSDARYRDHPKDFSKTRFLRYDVGGRGEKHTLSFAGNGSMEPQIWDIGELSSLRALLCSDWVDLNNAYADILTDWQEQTTMILPYPDQYSRHLLFLRCLKPLTPEDAAELKSLLQPEHFQRGRISEDTTFPALRDFVYTRISPEIEAEFIRQEVPLVEAAYGLWIWRAVPFHEFSDIPEPYQLVGLYPVWRGVETVYEVVCKGVDTGLIYLTACSNRRNARRNNVHAGAFAAPTPLLCGTADSSAYAVSAFCGIRVERTPEAVIYDPEASLSSETSKIIRSEFFRRTKLFNRSPHDLLPDSSLAVAVVSPVNREDAAAESALHLAVPGLSEYDGYSMPYRHPELSWTLDRTQTQCSNSLRSTASPLPSTVARSSNHVLTNLFDYDTDTLYLDAPSWDNTVWGDQDWKVMADLLQHYGIKRLIIKGQGPLGMKIILSDHGIKVNRTDNDIPQVWFHNPVYIPIPGGGANHCGADDLIAAIEQYLETSVTNTSAGNCMTPRAIRLWALCKCLEYRFRELDCRAKFYLG